MSVFPRIWTKYGEILSFRIQSECGKMRTRVTPNMDTFYAVTIFVLIFIINIISFFSFFDFFVKLFFKFSLGF